MNPEFNGFNQYVWDYKRVSLKHSKMATYMPLISAFNTRTAFWPPEAFTLDCRIEERIWEWCEHTLKRNEEFMALVNSDKPLDMEALWDQIVEVGYSNLADCIFHYWLIQNWMKYKEGGTICTENADWICARVKVKGPVPWQKPGMNPGASEFKPAPSPAPAPSAAAAAGAGASPEPRYTGPPVALSLGPAPAGSLEDRLLDLRPDPDVVGPISARLDGKFAEPVGPPPEPKKDVSVCLTSGGIMTVLRLSHIPTLPYEELRHYYRALQIHCGESWDPEECENAGILLEAIYNRLHA